MSIADVKKSLFSRFMILNDFSGINFIKNKNVSLPNEAFTKPTNKKWFELFFLPPEVKAVGMYEEAQDIWNGVFQIDICTPLGDGEEEADNKYEWISRLFYRGATFDDVEILKTYKATVKEEADHYRTIVRIEWEAIIDKEMKKE